MSKKHYAIARSRMLMPIITICKEADIKDYGMSFEEAKQYVSDFYSELSLKILFMEEKSFEFAVDNNLVTMEKLLQEQVNNDLS
jgi:hypothetical protein